MGSVWVYHFRAGWQRLRSWWRWSQIRFRIRGIGSQQFFLRRSAACAGWPVALQSLFLLVFEALAGRFRSRSAPTYSEPPVAWGSKGWSASVVTEPTALGR